MHKNFKIIGLVISILIIFGFIFHQYVTKNQNTHTFLPMSFETFQATEHKIPYSFKLIKPDQCLFYFGSNHSHDPKNEQYPALTDLWNEFLQQTHGKNCIVLIEGGLRNIQKTQTQTIIKDGEAGYATFLAHQASIPCICADPDDAYLKTELLKQFNVDEINYMRFTDIWHQFNEVAKNDASLNFKKYLQKFHNFLGKKNLKYFQNLHQQFFHEPFDVNNETNIRDTINLKNSDHIIGKIHHQNNVLRDEFIINQIQKLIMQGKNIFIVFGATHAMMQEPAIKNIWNS